MKTRREFIKAGFALGAAFSLKDLSGLFAAPAPTNARAAVNRSILVAVRDGTRKAMLDRALQELGGIGKFVHQGATVLIKPNIGWDVPPERSANTHPDLVGHLVALCLKAGAKSVAVVDNPCDEWRRAYRNSGIEQAVLDAGGRLLNGKDANDYRQTAVPGGRRLKSTQVHRLVLESDVFINIPVLKHHSGALMTAAMKNLMGCVWNRRYYHQNDLHQCIADFPTLRKPTLNIIDAYHPMLRHGPRGRDESDLVEMRTLLASTDIVAIDAAAAKMLGHQPADVRHVELAASMGLGVMDLDQVDIRRIRMS